MTHRKLTLQAAIIGGGPAGLMAAEALTKRGIAVDLFDAMPSLGRKFLMAGKSGLNLTHAEPFADFLSRFGAAQGYLNPMLDAFPPAALQAWALELGVETFVGSSGRVFPKDFKAAPLLRAWLKRLRANGLTIHARHKWTGWNTNGELTFATPAGEIAVAAQSTVLALGGASWPTLGSTAAWVPWLQAKGIDIAPLKPANCGFDVPWSAHFVERFEGHPLKGVTLSFHSQHAQGECIVTHTGLEGGPIYALSSALVEAIERRGPATINIDLLPDLNEAEVSKRLAQPKGKKSLATHLKRTLGLAGVKAGLLRERVDAGVFADPLKLAAAIKALPVMLTYPRPIAEAISTAGGVRFDQVDDGLQLKKLPGVFVAGEMLDWDAPTGGYLLSACMATGRWAGDAAANALKA
ncbi:MAG: TIGR03862 family flavoprotein [Rhodospirillales bacterium]|nr:TIGR03862 family flavoprotein [Rhodospirillales bacterium]